MILKPFKVHSPDGKHFYEGDSATPLADAAAIAEREPAYSWLPMQSAPRDGSNILIRFGRDHVSQAKYVAGTPHPWKFIESNDGVTWIINHAVDGEYGPSHWMPLPSTSKPEPSRAALATTEATDAIAPTEGAKAKAAEFMIAARNAQMFQDVRELLSTLTDPNAKTPGRHIEARRVLPLLDAFLGVGYTGRVLAFKRAIDAAPSPEAPATEKVWNGLWDQERIAMPRLASPEAPAVDALTTGAVAWEYRNQYGDPFLTHKDPATWHPHDKAGFKDFRALGYVADPAGAPKALTLTDEQIERHADAASCANGYGVEDGTGVAHSHWWTFDRDGLRNFAALLADRGSEGKS